MQLNGKKYVENLPYSLHTLPNYIKRNMTCKKSFDTL